jgi:hypothetical protein
MLDWYSWKLEKDPAKAADLLVDVTSSSVRILVDTLTSTDDCSRIDDRIGQWFLHQVLSAITRERFKWQGVVSEEGAETRERLGRFAAMTLAHAHHTPHTVEDLIWALSQYGYQVLGVDRRIHLASHIRHGARGEPSLHMTREFYRDHFFHTVEVCLLGDVFLSLINRRHHTVKAFRPTKEMRRQWHVASLLHDIGYAVDVTKGLRDWLDFFASTSFASLGEHLSEALKSMGAGLGPFYESLGFKEEDKPWEDHGLVGAHHLHTLVPYRPTTPINNKLFRRHVA